MYVEGQRLAYSGLVPDVFIEALSADAETASWAAQIDDPAHRVYAAAWTGGIVGLANGGLVPGSPEVSALTDVWVQKQWHGSSLAQELVVAVVQDLRAMGAHQMKAMVYAQNKRSESFCQKLGAKYLGWKNQAVLHGPAGYSDFIGPFSFWQWDDITVALPGTSEAR